MAGLSLCFAIVVVIEGGFHVPTTILHKRRAITEAIYYDETLMGRIVNFLALIEKDGAYDSSLLRSEGLYVLNVEYIRPRRTLIGVVVSASHLAHRGPGYIHSPTFPYIAYILLSNAVNNLVSDIGDATQFDQCIVGP